MELIYSGPSQYKQTHAHAWSPPQPYSKISFAIQKKNIRKRYRTLGTLQTLITFLCSQFSSWDAENFPSFLLLH